MIRALRHAWPLLLVALAATSRGQTGSLDQTSPINNASFSCWPDSLIWQQQVRAGLSGQLEGFSVTLTGPQGATVSVGIRIGPGWNTNPLVFHTIVTKPTSGSDVVFVDATSANIQISSGSLFVIEVHGSVTLTYIRGSYVDPQSGPPLYPEPIFAPFFGGTGCFADCGWRIGFMTYVLNTTGAPYCFGDGTGTACPCRNPGAAGNGCANSVNQNGANLHASGVSSVTNDSLVLRGSGMPNGTALYYQGTSQLSTAFGDGLRCAGGQVLSLGRKSNTNGSSQYPDVGDPSISVRGAVPPSGGVRMYQCWYRNAATFCTAAPFNLTNGLEVVWGL